MAIPIKTAEDDIVWLETAGGAGTEESPYFVKHTETNSAAVKTAVEAIVTALAGTIAASVSELPLPSGASTEAKQDTGNTHLSAIKTSADLIDDAIVTEDAASSGGEKMINVAGIRRDADTSPVSTDGDWHNFIFNALGFLKVTVKEIVNVVVGGNVAHDSADSGNPVKVGGRARTSDITAVANNDRTDFITDKSGKQINLPYAIPENFVSGANSADLTNTNSTQIIAAQGSGLKTYVTDILVTNSHSSTGTVVKILSGSTLLARGYAAPGGGGFAKNFAIPLVGGANTAINAQCETSGAAVQVTISGYKGA